MLYGAPPHVNAPGYRPPDMDPLDAMTDPIGSVPGIHGVNAVVNVRGEDRLVTTLFYELAASSVIERDLARGEAREVADLLERRQISSIATSTTTCTRWEASLRAMRDG